VVTHVMPSRPAATSGPQGHVAVRGTEALAAIFLGDETRASQALEQRLRIARDAEYLEPLDEALLIAGALAASPRDDG
jgi:hypothetical protein